MKSKLIKNPVLVIALLGFGEHAWSANTGAAISVNDTMIFSLFVVMALIFMMIISVMINTLKGVLEISELGKVKKEKKESNDSGMKAGTIIGILLISNSTLAQDGAAFAPLVTMTNELYWILIWLNAFLLGIIITLYFVSKGIINKIIGEEEKEVDAISQITASLTDAVPIEREEEIMLDHNYDGIRELDNNLPPWWKYGFYLTIVFAFAYIAYFHVFGGDLQTAEYDKEMAAAEIELEAFKAQQANLVDESNLTALTDEARLAAGKKVYVNSCQVCHGQNGEGMVGPNFTDKYWKHGGGIKNIFNTIKVGVPDKGMISWESQLTPGQMLEVASYILTLEGTNPANQKAPEGELWDEKSSNSLDSEKETNEAEQDAEKIKA